MRFVGMLLLLIAGFANGQEKSADKDVYNVMEVDVKPEYPGGDKAFREYIGKNMRLPEVDQSIDVRLYVEFVIDDEGMIKDVVVMRNPGYGLDGEVKRLLLSDKQKWKPASKDGKVVKSKYSLPISINITADKADDKEKD